MYLVEALVLTKIMFHDFIWASKKNEIKNISYIFFEINN
jgi:hypothetical protein